MILQLWQDLEELGVVEPEHGWGGAVVELFEGVEERGVLWVRREPGQVQQCVQRATPIAPLAFEEQHDLATGNRIGEVGRQNEE